MLRYLKFLSVFCVALSAATMAHAFALLGPSSGNPALTWQLPEIAYNLPGDIGGPMNLTEEYRWNIPIITYGFDQSFLSYFGTNGVKSIEQAVGILNSLPTASEMNLDDFSYDTTRVNYRAKALLLIDLKSIALNLLVEEMGLAEPERYVFTLRSRVVPVPGLTNYAVIQRNFDPITFKPSSYVNGILYSYEDIYDNQSGPNPKTFVRTFLVDPFTTPTSVAGRNFQYGNFYTGLTYDDAGGLKYLFSSTNLNTERILPDVFEVYTNAASTNSLTTLDLAVLIERSRGTTNDVPTLLAFPGYGDLHVTSTNGYLTNIVTTNITSFFTNFPYALGAAPQQVYITNYTTNVTTVFDYTFDNVITNSSFTRVSVTQQIDVVPSPIYQPGLGALITNITYLGTNYEVGGDFYVLPITNIALPRGEINANLGFQLISTQLVSIVTATNRILNVVSENVAITNTTDLPIRLDTLDLGALYQESHWTTNDPAQLLSIYPKLVITQTNAHFTNVITTNIASFFTNYPSLIPPGPLQVYTTNYATNVVLVYDYSFGNVVINGSVNHFTNFFGWDENFPANPPAYINGVNQFPDITWQTASIRKLELVPSATYSPGLPNVTTNILETSTETIQIPTGDFFIVPTNLLGYVTNSLHTTGTSTATNIGIYSTALLMTNEVKNVGQDLATLDLTTFIERARTNSPQELLSILDYADLVITTVSNYFVPVDVTNYVRSFTNAPYQDAFSPPFVEVTNVISVTHTIETNWVYTFGNIVTNTYYTAGLLNLQGSRSVFDGWAVAGSPSVSEPFASQFSSNFVNGTMFIVPTNLFGYILRPLSTNIFLVTNAISSTTNFFQTTNVDETVLTRFSTNYVYDAREVQILTTNDFATNDFGIRREMTWSIRTNTYEVLPIQLLTTNDIATNIYSRTEVVSYFTNMTLVYHPVVLRTPGVDAALRPGMGKLTFARMYNQTTLSTNYLPFTTNYVDTAFITTNGVDVLVRQSLRRTVFRPDIIFSAADLSGSIASRTVTAPWENNSALNSGPVAAGPGVIPGTRTGVPQIEITFNNVGPQTHNYRFGSQSFLSQAYLGQRNEFFEPLTVAWGSFDGTTNAPVIYPDGTSITDLESQILAAPSP